MSAKRVVTALGMVELKGLESLTLFSTRSRGLVPIAKAVEDECGRRGIRVASATWEPVLA